MIPELNSDRFARVFAIDTLYAVETSAKADRAEGPGEAKETCSKDSMAEA